MLLSPTQITCFNIKKDFWYVVELSVKTANVAEVKVPQNYMNISVKCCNETFYKIHKHANEST